MLRRFWRYFFWRFMEAAMPTKTDVKKIAMALDGVSEIDHWGRPAYRTAKRIFAVMRPDGLYLHLSQERKEFLLDADPEVFAKYMWGKTSNVLVQIGKISRRELAALIKEAWQSVYVSPKKSAQAQRTPRKRSMSS